MSGRISIRSSAAKASSVKSGPILGAAGGSLNHHFAAARVLQDPSGHLLEIITKPYGSK